MGAAGATVAKVGAVAKVAPVALATKLQAAAAALVLAGGAFWLWNGAADEPQELARSVPLRMSFAAEAEALQGPSETRTASVHASPAGSAEAPRREAVAVGEPAPDAAAFLPRETAFSYRITGVVRDEDDMPLAGARVFLGPRGLPLNRVVETDGEGRFALEFDGRRAVLDCVFTVDDGGGRMLGLTELHLVSGRELVVDVGLNPAANDGRSVVGLRGAESAVARASREEPVKLRYRFEGEDSGTADPEVVAEAALVLARRIGFASRSVDPLDRAPQALRGANGRTRFVDPPPSGVCAREPEPEELAFLGGLGADFHSYPGVDLRSYNALSTAVVELELSTVEGDPIATRGHFGSEGKPIPSASVRGIVRDALGSPQQGVAVVWSTPDHGRVSAVSGENGEYLLEEVPPGKGVVRAGGGDRGRARTDVTLAAEQELAWNPVLDRGNEVAGRLVLLESENALAGVLVELWSASPSFLWCDSTVTDGDGRFAIPNVPSGPLELFVYASGVMNPPSSFPIRIVRPVFAPAELGEIVLDVDDLVSGSLVLSVLDPDGEPLPGAEVRVWQGSSGRGCFAGEPDETGKLTLAGLPHGSFRVEAGGPFGWRDLGSIWFDEDVELAPERFAPAGFAQLDADSPDGSAVAASLWSVHPGVFASVGQYELGRASVMLRAGSYVVCAAARKGRRGEAALAVEPGSANALVLEASTSETIGARPGAIDPQLETNARCSACHASAEGGG